MSIRDVNGLTPWRSLDLDESEETVAARPVRLFFARIENRATGERFLKLYDGLIADVVVGTTTPKMTVPLTAGRGELWQPAVPMQFDTGLVVAATTGIADSDTGAPGANEVVVNFGYV